MIVVSQEEWISRYLKILKYIKTRCNKELPVATSYLKTVGIPMSLMVVLIKQGYVQRRKLIHTENGVEGGTLYRWISTLTIDETLALKIRKLSVKHTKGTKKKPRKRTKKKLKSSVDIVVTREPKIVSQHSIREQILFLEHGLDANVKAPGWLRPAEIAMYQSMINTLKRIDYLKAVL